MELYKKIVQNLQCGVGVLVPIPKNIGRKTTDIYNEFENPTAFNGNIYDWRLHKILDTQLVPRKKSMTELLFCILRSGFPHYFQLNETSEKGEIEKMQMVKECCRNCKHYTEGTCMLLPELLSVDDELVDLNSLKIEIKEPWDFRCSRYR